MTNLTFAEIRNEIKEHIEQELKSPLTPEGGKHSVFTIGKEIIQRELEDVYSKNSIKINNVTQPG